MKDKEIYRWKLPEDHHDFTGHDDLPEAYMIEENQEATCGIVIYGKYHGEWAVNPWNTRTLVKHLLDRCETVEAERDSAEAAFAELRDAVAWMIEVGSLIKDCESCSPMPARLSVSWVGMEEMYELLYKAEAELRRSAGVAFFDKRKTGWLAREFPAKRGKERGDG